MKKLFKVSLYIYFLFTLIVNLGCLKGFISFGHGLGDLYYVIFSLVILFICLIIFFKSKSNSDNNVFTNSFAFSLIVISILILILKLSILRGPE
jgi:hypothetical protein